MFELTPSVKRFIESHKDLIEQNNIKQLFEESYNGQLSLSNAHVDELVDVLQEIGIDTEELRYELLYDKLSDMFAIVITLRTTPYNRSLYQSMFVWLHHWLGFSASEVIEFVKKNALNFGVELVSNRTSPYYSDDYEIKFL